MFKFKSNLTTVPRIGDTICIKTRETLIAEDYTFDRIFPVDYFVDSIDGEIYDQGGAIYYIMSNQKGIKRYNMFRLKEGNNEVKWLKAMLRPKKILLCELREKI